MTHASAANIWGHPYFFHFKLWTIRGAGYKTRLGFFCGTPGRSGEELFPYKCDLFTYNLSVQNKELFLHEKVSSTFGLYQALNEHEFITAFINASFLLSLCVCLSCRMAYSWDNRVKFLVRFMYDIDNNGFLDKNDFECLAVRNTVIETKGLWDEQRFDTNKRVMSDLWNQIAELADFNKVRTFDKVWAS